MIPVLEQLALLDQLIEKFRLVIGNPRPEYVVMRAFDHRYGINLYIPQVFDRTQGSGLATAKGIGF